jgi:hypothetical protein
MRSYEIKTGAVITQTIDIDADCLETAQQWAMELLQSQIDDYQKDAIHGSNIHHSQIDVVDYETLEARETS